MRQFLRWTLRVALAAALIAAMLDVKVPRKGPRHRVYVIDASASVETRGSLDSFTSSDALRLVQQDIQAASGDDTAAVLAFGEAVVTLAPSGKIRDMPPIALAGIDPEGSRLNSALKAAIELGRGGDVILFTDGRATDKAEKREGVPIHVFPLGPAGVQDFRIVSIEAPSAVKPGTAIKPRVTMRSSLPGTAHLVAIGPGYEKKIPVQFTGASGVDVELEEFIAPKGSPLVSIQLKIESEKPDACLRNDQARIDVWVEDERTRVQIITTTGESALATAFPPERFDVRIEKNLKNVPQADVVILERFNADEAAATDLRTLADCVREGGVGLITTGGSTAYAFGGFSQTPVEQILPVWAFPDERSSVVLLIDRSGSMAEPAPGRRESKLADAIAAATRALPLMHPQDQVGVVTFASDATTDVPLVEGTARGRIPSLLSTVRAGGATVLDPALRQALSLAHSGKWGRKRIVLLTDGETPENLEAVADLLVAENVKLLIVHTAAARAPAFQVLIQKTRADMVDATDFSKLERTLAETLARSRELIAAPAAPAVFSHDLFKGHPDVPLARINRVSPKQGAEIVARTAEGPVVVIGRSGRGKTAAIMASSETGWEGATMLAVTVQKLAEHVSPGSPASPAEAELKFAGEFLEISVRLRSHDRPDRIPATLQAQAGATETIELLRRGDNLYEAQVPARNGTVTVRIAGRIVATRSRIVHPEFEEFGPDSKVLGDIARESQGQFLELPATLATLPRQGPTVPASIRSLLLGAALLLVFLDVAAAVFMK